MNFRTTSPSTFRYKEASSTDGLVEENGTRDRQEEDPSGPPTHGIELLVPQEGGIQEEDARAAEESTDQGPRDFHGASPPLSGKSWAQRPQMPVILD